MTFRVGQKVVCVDAGLDYLGNHTCLVKGRIYEIESIHFVFECGLVVFGAYSWHPLKGWRSSRFRPVVERKTDISVFTAILDGAKPKVTV